jgi:amino acid transporter
MAVIALIFAEHIQRALQIQGGGVMSKLIALIGVWGITIVNCLGVKSGAKVAVWFLVLKLGLIVSIVMAGVVVAVRNRGGYFFKDQPERSGVVLAKYAEEVKVAGVWSKFGDYATAGFAALWVYGGWEAVSSNSFHHLPCPSP